MSFIGKWIKAKCDASTDLLALVPARVYPVVSYQKEEQDVLAEIVWHQKITSADPNKTQRLSQYRCEVSFKIWAKTYDELDPIDNALQDALDFGEGTAGGITVVSAEWQNGEDAFDETTQLFCRVSNFLFKVKRT